jgi:hypothetical protein
MFTDPIASRKVRRRTPLRVAAADASRYLWVAVGIITLVAVLLLSAPVHAARAPSPYARAAAAHQAHSAASGPGFAPTMVQGQGLHHRARRATRPL